MALFTGTPELTIGNPERPKAVPAPAFVGTGTSDQIFTPGSGGVYMASIATRDTSNSTASLPLVAKRGTPWTLQDSTGFQDLEDVYGITVTHQGQCIQGNIIHFAVTTPAPFFLWYLTFDCSTDTFGTPVNVYTTGPGATSQPAAYPLIRPLSNGDLIIVWGSPGTTMTGARFAFVSSGSVGAANTLVADVSGQLIFTQSISIDASDTAHILYVKSTSGGSQLDLYHISVTSGGSVSSSTLIEGSIPFLYWFGPGRLYGGLITYVGCRGGNANIYLWESDPITISFTRKTVAARTNDTSGNQFVSSCVPVGDTRLLIVWPQNNPTPYPAQTATVMYSYYDGSSFDAAAVAWDVGDNPYPPSGISPSGDYDIGAAPSVQSSGSTLRLLGWSEFDSGYNETELYLEIPLSPPSSPRVNLVY